MQTRQRWSKLTSFAILYKLEQNVNKILTVKGKGKVLTQNPNFATQIQGTKIR